MRHFVIKFRKAPTDPTLINLKDLPGSGRIDVISRVVNSAFWLSWNIRKDVNLHIILAGPPNPPVYIRFEGERMKKVSPDERNIACFIKKALENVIDNEELEFNPGIFVSKKDLDSVLEKLSKEKIPFYLLEESGVSINSIKLVDNAVFILGDHQGFSKSDLQIIEKFRPIKVSLGKISYTTSHCIVILNYLLDQAYLK